MAGRKDSAPGSWCHVRFEFRAPEVAHEAIDSITLLNAGIQLLSSSIKVRGRRERVE